MFRTHTCGELRISDVNKQITLSGWVQRSRKMGGMTFIDLRDRYGITQLVFNEEINAELCDRANKLGREFVIQITGTVNERFSKNANIPTGDIEIIVSELNVLNTAMTPPFTIEDNTDGGDDIRMKYRYLDLRRNAVRSNLELRHKMTIEVRKYLDSLGFIEVETPVLNTTASGASARPFITHHNTLDIDMYMRIATELHLKMCIVGGLERVYEIGRIFRNEGMDATHNPEFTTIELYQAYTDYKGMMELAEGVIDHCCKAVNGGRTKITYQGSEIDLTAPFKRVTMNDAVREKTGVDFMSLTDEQARAEAKRLGVEVEDKTATAGKILPMVFDAFVEDTLIQPTFVIDYPVEISPLSKRKPDDPRLTERFELFIAGHEYANAFSELNDPIDQRGRFIQQAMERAKGDDEAMMIDETFCTALEYGMPPTGGIGLGIDRLVMLLTDSPTIRDVLLFPTMKPID